MSLSETKQWQIENKINSLRVTLPSLPKRGWISLIREALGMSPAQLAERLSISRQALSRLEKNEIDGSITLASLERAAQAMECDVMIALIPKKPLREIVITQAKKIARRIVERSHLHMGLEDQQNDRAFLEKQIESTALELMIKSPKTVWNEK